MVEVSHNAMVEAAVSAQLEQHSEQWDVQMWGALPAASTVGMKDAAAGQGQAQPALGAPQRLLRL